MNGNEVWAQCGNCGRFVLLWRPRSCYTFVSAGKVKDCIDCKWGFEMILKGINGK